MCHNNPAENGFEGDGRITYASETYPLKAGDKIGVYEIASQLGAGGMGVVLSLRFTDAFHQFFGTTLASACW